MKRKNGVINYYLGAKYIDTQLTAYKAVNC